MLEKALVPMLPLCPQDSNPPGQEKRKNNARASGNGLLAHQRIGLQEKGTGRNELSQCRL